MSTTWQKNKVLFSSFFRPAVAELLVSVAPYEDIWFAPRPRLLEVLRLELASLHYTENSVETVLFTSDVRFFLSVYDNRHFLQLFFCRTLNSSLSIPCFSLDRADLCH